MSIKEILQDRALAFELGISVVRADLSGIL